VNSRLKVTALTKNKRVLLTKSIILRMELNHKKRPVIRSKRLSF
jgi:hypothetical protein